MNVSRRGLVGLFAAVPVAIAAGARAGSLMDADYAHGFSIVPGEATFVSSRTFPPGEYLSAVRAGFMTPNEVRALHEIPPVDIGGAPSLSLEVTHDASLSLSESG
jgi:hypothetical protein